MNGNGNMAYVFDKFAHAGLGDTTTTKYLNGIPCSLLGTLCAIALQEPDRSYRVDESSPLTEERCFLTQLVFVLAACTSAGRLVSYTVCASVMHG